MAVVKGDRIGESSKLSKCSLQEQDAYVRFLSALPNRRGVFRGSWASIAARVYHGDSKGARRCARMVTVFERVGLLARGERAGIWRFVDFLEHADPPSGRGRPPIPVEVRLAVMERDGYACRRCGSLERLELDHVVPFSQGGPDTVENLQALCVRCNRAKGAGS